MPWSGHLLGASVLACLAESSAAQLQLVEATVPDDRPLVRKLTAPPRQFVELCTGLQAGRSLDWAFEAEAPVAFNTHFHLEGAVKYPEEMTAVTSARGRLDPAGGHVYCWLWSNPGATAVTIRVQINP